jgi:hypothetical protein
MEVVPFKVVGMLFRIQEVEEQERMEVVGHIVVEQVEQVLL